MASTTWCLVVNTMSGIAGTHQMGTAISSHRSLEAAYKASRDCQPKERGAYVPVAIVTAQARHAKGELVDRRETTRVGDDEYRAAGLA